MITLIKNGRVISGGEIKETSIYIRDGIIERITDDTLPYDRMIDAEYLYVSPGFIDLHMHGGGGYDVMDGGMEAIMGAAHLHLQHGTTTLYPTSVCASTEQVERFISDAGTAQKIVGNMPHIPGIHLEGPYLSKQQCGAQNTDYIILPEQSEYERLMHNANGLIKRWSFAPELAGAEKFCRFLTENGIVPSIAHSDALYSDVEKVYNEGCRLITHFYSAMSMVTREKGYRRLGVVESGYLLDDMYAEVICDGKHLPPELLRLVYKVKGSERICLVTDAMRAAGTEDKTSVLGPKDCGLPVIIEDNVAKTLDHEGFAGSIATADRLIRTAYTDMGASLPEAVRMMTEIPARIMGLNKKGSISEGFDADLLFFDEDINIKKVIMLYDF